MAMQIRGTVTPNDPPSGLAERQLSVEMGSSPPKLWCGVPASIDPSGRVQLNAGTLDPATAGNFLRTNIGTWVEGLPLVGGTMRNATIVAADAAAVPRWSLNLTGAGATQNFEISRYNTAGTTILSTPLSIDRTTGFTTFAQQVIINANLSVTGFVAATATNATFTSVASFDLQLNKAAGANAATLTGRMGAANRWRVVLGDTAAEGGGNTGRNFAIQPFQDTVSATPIDSPLAITRATGVVTISTALDINNTGTGDSLRIRNGATDHFVIAADGTVTMSAAFAVAMRTALGI